MKATEEYAIGPVLSGGSEQKGGGCELLGVSECATYGTVVLKLVVWRGYEDDSHRSVSFRLSVSLSAVERCGDCCLSWLC